MEKYFSNDENIFMGDDLLHMHKNVVTMSGILASNLFFRQACKEAEEHEHKVKLARSCYALIMVCESIVEKYAKDAQGEGFENMRGYRELKEKEYRQEQSEIAELIKKMMGL